MKKQLVATIAIATVLLFPSRATHAVRSTILQPASVTTNVNNVQLNAMIDQSGLSSGYTNEDDFSTATMATHVSPTGQSTNTIAATAASFPVLFTFSFDNIYNIEGLALWNDRFLSAIHEFELYVDDDNDFDNGGTTQLTTLSGMNSFSAEQSDSAPLSAQIFDFSSTSTQFVHLNVRSNFNSGFLTIPEVAFAQSAVAVPFEFGSIPGIIFMATVGGANFFRNKRNRKDK